MSLKKHIPTIEDRIQERIDLQKTLKNELKVIVKLIESIQDTDKKIKKLESKKNKTK